MCIYFGYVITNLIDDKKYIGVHQTKNLNDSYMGSGIHLRRAINKYGKENFTKEIIEYFDNKHQMFLWEAIIVTQDIVDDPMYYNMKLGGFGGWDAASKSNTGRKLSPEHRLSISSTNQGHSVSSETCAKISAANKNPSLETRVKMSEAKKGKIPWNKGKQHSIATREQMSLSRKGKPAHNKGIPFSDEARKNMKESHKNVSPETRLKISLAAKARAASRVEILNLR